MPESRQICCSSVVICFTLNVLLPNLLAFPADDLNKKSENNAALRGTNIVIPCVPASSSKDVLLDLATEYQWTDAKGADLVDPRFSKDDSGSLEIIDLHVADSGIYKCKAIVPENTASEKTIVKVFIHKLLVYELTGHKYTTRATFMLGKQTVNELQIELGDLLLHTVCKKGDLCKPLGVQFEKCQLVGLDNHKCTFVLSFSANDMITDENCDEECVKSNMLNDLNTAYVALDKKLKESARDPKSPIKPDLNTLTTRHLITCNAGFRLIKSHLKRCFPCQPGTYSGPNSPNCSLCDIGFYQENYGKRTCNSCPEGKTTDNLGSTTSDDCIEEQKTVLDTIKNGFLSIFG